MDVLEVGVKSLSSYLIVSDKAFHATTCKVLNPLYTRPTSVTPLHKWVNVNQNPESYALFQDAQARFELKLDLKSFSCSAKEASCKYFTC